MTGVEETVADTSIVAASEMEPVTVHDSVAVGDSVGVLVDDRNADIVIDTECVFVTGGDAVRVPPTVREMLSEKERDPEAELLLLPVGVREMSGVGETV